MTDGSALEEGGEVLGSHAGGPGSNRKADLPPPSSSAAEFELRGMFDADLGNLVSAADVSAWLHRWIEATEDKQRWSKASSNAVARAIASDFDAGVASIRPDFGPEVRDVGD